MQADGLILVKTSQCVLVAIYASPSSPARRTRSWKDSVSIYSPAGIALVCSRARGVLTPTPFPFFNAHPLFSLLS